MQPPKYQPTKTGPPPLTKEGSFMPSPPNHNSTNELLLLYDDFTKFQSQCTFLCDAVVALAMSELVMDKWSVNGLHMNAVQVKRRAEVLGEKLQVLRGDVIPPQM
jgi:hypothetical protein